LKPTIAIPNKALFSIKKLVAGLFLKTHRIIPTQSGDKLVSQ
jgi:hypothetical protein